MSVEKNTQLKSYELSFIQGQRTTIQEIPSQIGLRNCSEEGVGSTKIVWAREYMQSSIRINKRLLLFRRNRYLH